MEFVISIESYNYIRLNHVKSLHITNDVSVCWPQVCDKLNFDE
jgi:hypothetical protein